MPLTGNLLLDSLSSPLRDSILAAARGITIPVHSVLVRVDHPPANLIFLTGGMAAMVLSMVTGETTEVGMLGSESLTGVTSLLGGHMVRAACVMQIAGSGLQVSRSLLQDLFRESAEFREHTLALVQSQMVISAQIAACNTQHQADARLARWLLIASDLTGIDMLPLTQDYLAQMLGAQRTTVSMAANVLQRSGAIRYARGHIQVTDRQVLQQMACECYATCRDAVAGLYVYPHPVQATHACLGMKGPVLVAKEN